MEFYLGWIPHHVYLNRNIEIGARILCNLTTQGLEDPVARVTHEMRSILVYLVFLSISTNMSL